ncbi:MAG: amino acid ABC transporter substrate-binding protein [Stellaceae bacterium]
MNRHHIGGAALAAAALLSMTIAMPISAQAAKQPIKIGFSMELSGPLASGGTTALRAMKIWEHDINAKGGLLGRRVKLVYYDDQSNPANVPGIYEKLIDVDKVNLLVSSYGTNLIAPAMPVAMEHNMVFMTLFGTAVNNKFHYGKYFQILPNGPQNERAVAQGWFDIAMSMNPKPKTVALVAADAEYAQNVIGGAREVVKKLPLKIVYDKSYPPSTVDYTPIIRAIAATHPDLIYAASYPHDTVGLIKAAHEVGLKTEMFGGGMIGLAFAPIDLALGPLMNGVTAFAVYVPAKTMQFPGIKSFLTRYRKIAGKADPLGFYLPPFAYAELQVLGDAVKGAGSLNQDKLAKYIHSHTFHTIVGKVTFAPDGEWTKTRALFVQYQGINNSGLKQFQEPGHQVILYPPKFVSGKLEYPYSTAAK